MSSGSMVETIDSILTFWFGHGVTAKEISDERQAVWFGKNDDVDLEIRTRFESVTRAVFDGRLDHWRETPRGMLASIICCDQFPRNMYRGRAESFAFDAAALAMAEEMVAAGTHLELQPIQRVFAYLPFEHSEDLAMQDKSMELFGALAEQADPEDREMFGINLDFARRHLEIIERFGRFPHRNAILGRESTDEETEFLTQPGSSF